jgi:hypothetical protein
MKTIRYAIRCRDCDQWCFQIHEGQSLEKSARLAGDVVICSGKGVLIKAVTHVLPAYSMSCFKLPRGLCEHINSLVRNFWWGNREGKRKTCWVAWEEINLNSLEA